MVDDRHMRRALELAHSQRTHPNPRVGAVIVDESGAVLGEGAHAGAGHDHAEVVALHQAGSRASGATMYVTLEPCTHQGRTPPCVEAIVAAGVARVFIGATDPDPRVAGSGISRLKAEGIEVSVGVLEEQARATDAAYFHHRETGLPRVTLKYAMTLDGAVAAADTTSRWITSDVAREDAHRLRAEADAVVVGAGTLRADDPLLSVRLPDYAGEQPVAVVVAGGGPLPPDARIWGRNPIVIATSSLNTPTGTVLEVEGRDQLPDPVEACRALADLGHLDLLLEGGPKLAGEWWRAGLIGRGVIYVGAKLGGGSGISPFDGMFETIDDASVVSVTGVRSLGNDVRIDFEQV